jgi:hypothetical protein
MNESPENRPPEARSAPASSQGPLPFDPDDLVRLRLRRADMARLLGISRSRMTQLTQQGVVPVSPAGWIDVNEAVSALLRAGGINDPQLRFLRPLRRRIAEAEANAAEALAARDCAVGESAELRALVAVLGRRLLESEAWLSSFQEELSARLKAGEPLAASDLDEMFEATGAAVLGRPLAELAITADPEALELVAPHLPELGAPPCPA